MFKKKEQNKTLDTLLKIFLAVGIVAGVCVIEKIIYDKYKQKLCLLCDDDDDCDCKFECLDNDGLDCDCENCEYASGENKEAEESENTTTEVNAEA